MTRLRKSLEYQRFSVNLSAVLMKMTGKTYTFIKIKTKAQKRNEKMKSTHEFNIIQVIIILYCMAMRGIPEYIAQARTILHASVGQVQYGPSAGNIFWYPPNIKPCNIIIIIYKNRHVYFNYRGCG